MWAYIGRALTHFGPIIIALCFIKGVWQGVFLLIPIALLAAGTYGVLTLCAKQSGKLARKLSKPL